MRSGKRRAARAGVLATGLLLLGAGGAAWMAGLPAPAGAEPGAAGLVPAVPTLSSWAVLALAGLLVLSTGWMLLGQRKRS